MPHLRDGAARRAARPSLRLLPPSARWPMRVGAAVLEWASGLQALGRVHARLGGGRSGPGRFLRDCLDWLDLRVDLPTSDLERVPAQGSCLVVANHPTGCLEGLLLMHLLTTVRPDVRVLANRWLGMLPELAGLLLPVDVFGGRRNDASARAALRHLRAGGLLLAFPAGAVAARRLWQRRSREQPWAAGAGGLQRLSGACVVPVHVAARVPSPFELLGSVHPLVRTALLPRVLSAQHGAAVAVRFGHPIPAAQLERFATDRERVDYLRLRSDILARRLLPRTPLLPARPARTMAPLAGPEDRAALAAEIAALPGTSELLRSGGHSVRVARAGEVPTVLREIGRLRELTFRGVGEGTGRSRDLDAFDADYLHLFVWSEVEAELVGAYRLGPTDELLPGRGAAALYTSTLYRFEPAFLARMQPALELGRSFVQPRYQRSQIALPLLWRGIGAFVARHPRYRRLFGPVSISGQHDAGSVRLIVAHLEAHCSDPELSELATPRRPWRVPARLRRRMPVDSALLGDLDGVGAMVRELEVGRQGVPVLLEQYLRLGARVAGCNLDPDFGTLDALVVVDLLRTPPQRARRYLGAQGLAALQAWHAAQPSAQPAAPAVAGPGV